MAKRLRVSLLGILTVLMCFALAFGFTAWNGGITANAATVSEDGTTVTFEADTDFTIKTASSGKVRLDDLSEAAYDILFAEDSSIKHIVIKVPNSVQMFYRSFGNMLTWLDNIETVRLELPASVSTIPFDGEWMQLVKSITVDPASATYAGDEQGRYLVTKSDKTLVWSNGTIPADAEVVTAIGSSALKSVQTIAIPANITSIAAGAFDPSAVKNITVAAGNTAYSDGGNKNCLIDIANKKLILSPSGYIPADGSVTAIADGALFGVQNVIIPAQIESLTKGAFDSALKSLTIDKNNALYSDGGNNSFITKADKKLVFATSATNLDKAFDGIEIVGTKAFAGLDITNIAVPESVVKMEKGAFWGLPKLASISLPFVGGHKTVEGDAPAEDTLFAYIFYTGEYIYSPERNDYFEITSRYSGQSGVAPSIRAYIPKKLKTVSVTGAGISFTDLAFDEMEETNVENLYVPEDLVITNGMELGLDHRYYIKENKFIKRGEDGNVCLYSSADHSKPVILFYGDTTAKQITIPEGVTTIGVEVESSTNNRAYKNAEVIELVLPSTLKRIASESFDGCTDLVAVYNLSDLEIQKGSADHGKVALYANVYDSFDGWKLAESGDYTFIASDIPVLFRYNGTATNLTLPTDYDGKRYNIANDAFSGNTVLTDVVIPANSALNIGNNAFENCTSLKSIVINDLENSIGNAAFKGCTALNAITFNNCHITEIADEAFMNCSSLLEIAVPDTVLTIGTSAFEECTSAVAITLGNKVEYIGGKAFANTSSLKTATIPDSVTELGYGGGPNEVGNPWKRDYVFAGSGIESVYIGSGLQYMGFTFSDCVNLKEISFSQNSSLKNISYAFVNCTALTTLTIPEGVIKAQYALNGVTNLTSLYIPYSLVNVTSTASADLTTRYSDMSLRSTESPYPEYAHLTMYLPDLPKDATAEEIDAFARKLAVFAVYSDYNSIDSYVMGNSQFNVNTVFANQVTVLSKEAYDAVHKVLSDTTDGNLYSTFTTFGRYFSNYEGLHREDVLSHFYYLTDVKYELYKLTVQEKPLATETVQKLAQNEGADIRCVLKTDKYGSKYYAIDSNYAMPSMINGMNTGATWKVGTTDGEALDLATAKISGKTTFVNLLGADDKLTVNYEDEYTKDYNGKAWTLAGTSLEGKADITSATLNGNSVDVKNITDAGTYTVTVTANSNYEFASGESTATFTVVINKVQATVTWKWNEKTLTEGNTESKDFDGKTIASQLTLSYVDVNGDTQAISNGLLRRLLNGTGSTANAMNEGLWTLYLDELVYAKDHPNYTFAHASHEFRIYNKKLSADDVLNGTEIDLEGAATLNSGMLYIYEDNSHNIIPSRTPMTGYTLVEVINVERSIVRYTNREWTLAATVKSGSADKLALNADGTANNTQTAIGRQTTTFVFNAKDNYEFASSINGGVAERGIAFTVSADGKTLTVTKTWYVVQLANELVKATYTGTNEPTDDDLYTVIDWTYGADVSFALPKLWHGSDADNVNHVKFTLNLHGKADAIVSNAARADLLIYLNKYMPAGDYTLTFTVDAFDTADASYPTFSRIYDFTVAKATIGIDSNKLPKDETTGYASYEWELTANANKELFFKTFADKINAAGVLQTVVMDAPEDTFWGTDDGKAYFGTYSVKYNFARMNNERYELATNNYLYEFIAGGSRGTYTVYFQIEMPNHENLTNVGEDGRYAYFFTVVVYETVDPVDIRLDNVKYTGLKNIPTLNETDVYHVEYVENDEYIDAGEHALILVLNDSVHYRWKGVAAGETGLSVKYTIEKALNEFIEAPDIVRWVEGKFNADENGFIGAAKFGTISYVITDTNDNVIYDLSQNIDKRADMKAGTYILKATVVGNDNYNGLTESFTIRILEKVGLPWWAVLLIVVGSLGVAALIIFILWKKGVFQILTQKIVVAIRTKASVDATIASVRAAKKMEEGKQSVADAKRRERIEQLIQKSKEQRALPPEERAAQLEAKAQADEERADKLRAKVEATRARARKMRGEQPEPVRDVTDSMPIDDAAATVDTDTPAEE